MPQTEDIAEVSFTVPVHKDSLTTTEYRTVHVIIPKAKPVSDGSIIIRPLTFIVPVAAVLIIILLKIRTGKKTDKVLDALENITGGIEKDRENGIRKF